MDKTNSKTSSMCKTKIKKQNGVGKAKRPRDHSWKLNNQFTGTPERESRSREMTNNTLKFPMPKDISLQAKIVQLMPSIREKAKKGLLKKKLGLGNSGRGNHALRLQPAKLSTTYGMHLFCLRQVKIQKAYLLQNLLVT